MHPIVEAKRDDVAALCRRLGVRRLELFGSAARDDFDESRSDIDFLVEFDDHANRPVLETFFGLQEGLEQLFGRPVDLVSRGAVDNPYVRASMDRDKQLIYAT